MSQEDDDRERFFASLQVTQDALGQVWRYSSYGRGGIPAWHPARLGRRRGAPRNIRQDIVNGSIFLAIVFGIPAIALFAPARYKVIATISYAATVVAWIAFAMTVSRLRVLKAQTEPPDFPHPGPKGHHQHD